MYALTTQIILLDCLSDTHDLDPKCISRLVIKDTDTPINDKFSLITWLTTLIRLNYNPTPITFISTKFNKFLKDKL